MLFNSFEFLVFFILVTTAYFALPYKWRWVLLLAASCYFYMAFVPVYILILGFTIVIDYYAGIWIGNAEGKRRKLFLIISIIANVGVLAVFKYYNFLNDNITAITHEAGWTNPIPYLEILLPIGLSFHTFQAMSYTIEVYRGNQKAEQHFGIYSLYVMFYPQLVAGPIERPQNLLHQFRENFDFDYARVTSGLRLIAWGLFKKVVIADRLSLLVDQVYEHPNDHNSFGLILATIFFSFQIFCDFSGYSDIAIGTARILGFKLMKNFNRPYQSKTINEFWKRWHISLSTWFKDYLYISLGGNKVAVPRWYFNLFIVFLISGLWHGANWTFVIWGALHGFYLVFALITENPRKIISKKLGLDRFHFLKVFTTFILVAFAWIFFRAKTIDLAFYIAKHIFIGFPKVFNDMWHGAAVLSTIKISTGELLLSVGLIIFMEIVHFIQRKKNISELFMKQSPYFRWTAYYGVIFAIILLGVYKNQQFIYFQF